MGFLFGAQPRPGRDPVFSDPWVAIPVSRQAGRVLRHLSLAWRSLVEKTFAPQTAGNSKGRRDRRRGLHPKASRKAW